MVPELFSCIAMNNHFQTLLQLFHYSVTVMKQTATLLSYISEKLLVV